MLDPLNKSVFSMKVIGAVLTPSEAIQTYLRAKDQNRPHMMKLVFAEAAKLEILAIPAQFHSHLLRLGSTRLRGYWCVILGRSMRTSTRFA
jgi:hypothetical protein